MGRALVIHMAISEALGPSASRTSASWKSAGSARGTSAEWKRKFSGPRLTSALKSLYSQGC